MTTIRNISYACASVFFAALLLYGATSVALAAYQTEMIPNGDQVVGDFVVGPGKTEITVAPGEEKQAEIIVTNRMGETRRFNLEVEDIRGSTDPEESVVLLGSERGPYSLRDYIKIPEMSFELRQGERARIPVTIAVPADAEPGGLYGSVLVTTTSLPGSEGESTGARGSSVVVSRIGTLFLVNIPGEVKQEGGLVDFSTVPEQSFFSKGPITFQLLFENTGSKHLNPYGGIRITNVFGKEVGVVVADPWFALPASLRLRELSWDREYLFGYYTATAEINRGYNDEVDTMQVSFFVIPWQIVLAVFVVLLALFFLIRLFTRTFEFRRREP